MGEGGSEIVNESWRREERERDSLTQLLLSSLFNNIRKVCTYALPIYAYTECSKNYSYQVKARVGTIDLILHSTFLFSGCLLSVVSNDFESMKKKIYEEEHW